MDDALDRVTGLHALLRERRATLASAESLTGGLLAGALTSVAGSSETFVGGFVTYAGELKMSVLGVSPAVLEQYGAVSAECAQAMAEGARRATGATYAMSTTGVAGPGPQDGVPAGTVFVSIAGPAGCSVISLALAGDRSMVREQTCHEAVSALSAILTGEETGLG